MMRTQDSLPHRTITDPVPPGRMSMFFMAGFPQLTASGSALDDLFLSEAEEGGKKINFLAFLVFLRDWTATRFDLPERAANQMEDIVIFSSAVFICQANVLDSRFDNTHSEGQGYHLIVTNPPFSGTVHPQLLPANLSWLKGSLPGGVFDPYSGIATQILIFRRGGQSESVWFYRIFGPKTHRSPCADRMKGRFPATLSDTSLCASAMATRVLSSPVWAGHPV
ncbi:MAG: hypothetical protein KJ077_36620 [Anaerolineae bacterium]|nr:hypothetical protein [Anaerolineae bacterium]